MRDMDAKTIASGVPGEQLMEEAGFRCFEEIIDYSDRLNFELGQRYFLVVAGIGNNGGDGFVIARYLHQAGFECQLCICGDSSKIAGDAKLNYQRLPEDIPIIEADKLEFEKGVIIIDALFGSGIRGELRDPYAKLVEQLNYSEKPIVAIDVPSGLTMDTNTDDCCIKAELTVTIGMPKYLLFQEYAPYFVGQLRFAEISLLDSLVEAAESEYDAVFEQDIVNLIPEIDVDSHKGDHGRISLIGGSKDYPGAICLSALAAMRAGAGLTTVVYPESIDSHVATVSKALIRSKQPGEYLCNDQSLIDTLSNQDVIAVGPGIGSQSETMDLIGSLLKSQHKLVIDADGLRVFETFPDMIKRDAVTVMTPHPGEMKRLLNYFDLEALNTASRIEQAKQVALHSGAYIILKGRYTVIASPSGEIALNTSGSPALAAGGSGDVLTGIIAALLYQLENPMDALKVAVFVHGRCGEYALSKRAFIADDIIDQLAIVWSELTVGG